MEFLKIFADMEAHFKILDKEEQADMIMAMMAYAFHDIAPCFDPTNKVVIAVWLTMKNHIDHCRKEAENGKKGGRPKKQKPPFPDSKTPLFENENPPLETQKPQDKTRQYRTGNDMTYSAGEPIIGIDDSDMREGREEFEKAEFLVRHYGLDARNDQILSAVLDDIYEHGYEKVDDALKKASMSSNRGISVNYYRAILAGKRVQKPGEQEQGEIWLNE